METALAYNLNSMWSIAFKELRLFFSSPIGLLTIGIFLILNALLFWIFESPANILKAGFGDLTLFFDWTPRLLLFLIPALCMRSFSEEIRNGTLELLLTKPLTPTQIVGGKFLGVFLLLLIALLATTVNVAAIHNLLAPTAHLDWGSIMASYMGLLLMSIVFIGLNLCVSIGLKNQVSALLAGIIICFAHYDAWQLLADTLQLSAAYETIINIGMKAHYFSMSRGIFTFEDLCYFVLTGLFFLYCSVELLKRKQRLL